MAAPESSHFFEGGERMEYGSDLVELPPVLRNLHRSSSIRKLHGLERCAVDPLIELLRQK
jgi:hypothetical protein